MSKKISSDLTRQASVDLLANQDVRAEDWKRMFANQNFVGAHKGMRFGGFSWQDTITSASTGERKDSHIHLAGYLQRSIDGDGYLVRADVWGKNITVDLDIYNAENLNTNINGSNGFIKTLTVNRSSGTLGWSDNFVSLDPADTTQNLQIDGDPALIEIIPRFSDNGGNWELGQLDVFEKVINKTSRLVFRRTPLAFPEVQNDGTVEVSNADTLNFGEGVTATNPTGDEAKIVGPKNTNESTSYDEIRFTDSGDISVSVSTTSITDDSGETGTRLDVDIDENVATTTDTRFDFYENGNFIENDVDNMDFVGGNSINLTATDTAGDDAELQIGVNESDINHNNLINSSADAAHHGGGTGLNLSGGDMNVDDPLSLGVIKGTTRLESNEYRDVGGPTDISDINGSSAKGELASFCTVYAVARGSRFDGNTETINYTENCSVSYDTSTDRLTVTFDDAYSNGDHYVPVALAQNSNPGFVNAGTGSVAIKFNVAPGDFAVAIIGWDANQV